MNSKDYDLIVIGGGPAGYAGAIRASQLGRRVACIEMEHAGGTCLNWGCIPSKALLKSAELYQKMQHTEDFGFKCENISVDFAKVMSRSRNVANQMGRGVEFLLKKNDVDYFVGKAKLESTDRVQVVEGEKEGTFYTADHTLIATGCKPRTLPHLKVDGEIVMTSREILAKKSLPKSCIVLGAGAIGMEFAYFLNAFGCQVTLVEMLDRVLPMEDEEVSKFVARSFEKQGMKIYTGVATENIRADLSGAVLNIIKNNKPETLKAASLLLAIGVQGNLDGTPASAT